MNYEPPYEDPRWQRELDRIAPRTGLLAWLKLVWEPGDRWEPIGRWCVYQMFPQPVDPYGLRAFLNGPNPRTMGYFSGGRWHSTAPPISMRQWVLHRETGCFPEFFWVIQGSLGGHKRRFNHVEEMLLEMQGYRRDPPNPGDLPYAEPDERFFQKMRELKRIDQHADLLGRLKQSDEEKRKNEEAFRARVWDWLVTQTKEIGERGAVVLEKVIEDSPWTPEREYQIDKSLERAREDFILTGR